MPALPQVCPSPRELDDLELLLSGALDPIRGFDEPGSPVTLDLPDDLAETEELELVDPEGLPLARAERLTDGSLALSVLSTPEYGPFRRRYLTPEQVRRDHAGRTVVVVSEALTEPQVDQLQAAGPSLVLVLCGHGYSSLSPVALLRATLLSTERLDTVVVAVPLAGHGDRGTDRQLAETVVAAYAGDDAVIELAPGGAVAREVAEIVAQDRPDPAYRGLVLFFTGLSGSGKSTLARALMDRLLEAGERTVTSLDGDVVRRHLSAGLTFSKADRETNIRRIGWVAAEISRHGGVAVCSPIAPFDETRQQVRAMVDEAGGAFFLVHVATPLEECERRDRKGLYAKARAGEIPEFTGISSPYEEPEDADVRVDTTGRTIDAALSDVVTALADAGYLTGGTLVEQGTPTMLVEEGAPRPSRNPVTEAATPPTPTSPLNVLFVCTANICRSPFMELLARHLAGDAAISFTSAGTQGFDSHEMDPAMAAELAARGVPTDGFASSPVTAENIASADLVLTAESSHRTQLLETHPGAFRKIFTLGQFVQSSRKLPADIRGRELVESLGTRRGNADPALDVHDPYRRGPEAIRAAATQLDELLRAAVARLV